MPMISAFVKQCCFLVLLSSRDVCCRYYALEEFTGCLDIHLDELWQAPLITRHTGMHAPLSK